MNEPKKLIDTPSQTAGPFLHIGCTPRIAGINILQIFVCIIILFYKIIN